MNNPSIAAPSKPARKRMTQAERVARSDSLMFESACKLIIERGSQNATLREIGEMAGYSRGLASNRFGSKEALVAELLTFLNRQWVADLHRFVGGRTGLAAFCAALDAVEDFLTHQSQHARAMYILFYESLATRQGVLADLAGQQGAQRADIERWISEGIAEGFVRPNVSAHRFAIQYCSFIYGTVYQWLVNPSAIDLEKTFEDYKEAALAQITERRRSLTAPPRIG